MRSKTIAFLFTDIEGSTRRWDSHPDEMSEALARHDALIRRAVDASGGRVFKAIGDAFCAVFPTPGEALAAVLAAHRALDAQSWGVLAPLRVRAAIHFAAAEERDQDYFGPALNRVARLLSAGHGGQTLLSRAAADAVADALPKGVSLRDLGERRLKDLVRPEHVFQVVAPGLPEDFPPLRTLEGRPNNLSAQATALIGRETELAEIRRSIRRDGVRLLTISGTGGAGKTRLALQAGADLVDEFAHGAWFVALAAVREPGLVLPAIAAALGVKEAAGLPIRRMLTDFLGERQLLLILDNFEQVLDASAEVATLLEAAPGLKVIVTSRSLLRIYGEQDFALPPLQQAEGVRLFAERARAAKSDFSVTDDNRADVAALCAQLDGLPLAIELAAGQSRLFSPKALLAELSRRGAGPLDVLSGGARNLPERQRTLRGAISWSYELLDAAEREAFRRLGVFSGGWDREAAAVVLGEERVMPVLGSLLDKSLVRANSEGEEVRFGMLRTLRDFAHERLKEHGEGGDYRQRHADYYLALAQMDGARLEGPDQQRWSERLESELGNFRAVLDDARDRRDADAALRLGAGLGPFWNQRGLYTEGRDQLESVLGLDEGPPTAARARAVLALGQMHAGLGELPQALAQLEKADGLFRTLGDAKGEVDALTALTRVLVFRGEHERAQRVTEELIEKTVRLGEPRRRGLALARAASLALDRGQAERVAPMLEEALVLVRQAHDKLSIATLLNTLGEHVRAGGDFARAAGLYEESLTLSRELSSAYWSTVAAGNLAVCLLRLGRSAEALPLATETLTAAHCSGNKHNVPPGLILVAALAAAAGEPEQAAVLLGAAEKLLGEQNAVLIYADRVECDETTRSVRAALDAGAYESARAAGRELTLCSAVERALKLASDLKGTASGTSHR
ncbi:MAG: hypothetical protein HYV14_10735 [Elusimicrobia bacterium]|nr:hypothetical protein [Elusimicrobiota bacterium]